MSWLSLKKISGLFRKEKELPEELVLLVSSATFHARSFGEEPRVLVFLSGYNPFIYSRKMFLRYLNKYFPKLNENMRGRAVRLMEGVIVNFYKEGSFPENKLPKQQKKRNWINNW